jgi:hypothetical protein
MRLKGINYDVGTRFGDQLSRVSWRRADVQDELRVIRDELHCNAVQLFGSDITRLAEAGEIARELGLGVWLQPRLIDGHREAVLDHVAQAAGAAEHLRRAHGDVVLNVGCELTVFSAGIVRGRSYNERAARLARPYWGPALPLFSSRLNRLLARACRTARREFAGPLSYGAGLWERVDWEPFDFVGLNYYRLKFNRRRYSQRLRRHTQRGTPVVITEFGCGTFAGAADRGPTSHAIVHHGPAGPTIPSEYERSEREQARYLAELLAVFGAVGVDGAFVFEFVEPYKPHSPDSRQDLDMSSYGIVKVLPGAPTEPFSWEPKAAFAKVASIYSGDAARSGVP